MDDLKKALSEFQSLQNDMLQSSTRINSTTYTINLPAGEGTLSYTKTQDRMIDQTITGSGNKGGVVKIEFEGNTAKVTTQNTADDRFGFLSSDIYITFYRSRL